MFACVCVSSLNCYCYAAERQESQELNFLLPNSPFCQHLNFNFHLLSLSPLSHSILSLIFFDLCTPLSASNLPRRPHYPQLMQPDPLFPCFFFFAFLLSPDPRNTHTHTHVLTFSCIIIHSLSHILTRSLSFPGRWWRDRTQGTSWWTSEWSHVLAISFTLRDYMMWAESSGPAHIMLLC